MDEFLTRVAADKRVSGFFAGVARDPARLAGFKSTLVDLIGEASGLCPYAEQRHEARSQATNFKVSSDNKQTPLGVGGPMKQTYRRELVPSREGCGKKERAGALFCASRTPASDRQNAPYGFPPNCFSFPSALS